MGYRLVVIILFLLPLSLQAQNEYFNSEEFWRKLVPETAIAATDVAKLDTAIIVVSNRATCNNALRFMSEVRNDTLYYFFIYVYQHKWNVLKVKTLEQALSYIPDKNRDWVVYTEGMGKIFTSGVDRAMRLTGTYKVNVLLLDYPSISTCKKPLGNYFFALNNSRIAYKDFLLVFIQIKDLRLAKKMGDGNFNLFFHSMGNNVMKELIENRKLAEINDAVWVDNVILNAPCVQQRKHWRWIDQIKFAKNIVVHYNPKDRVLGAASILALKKQLGRKVKNPISCKATYINFNTLTEHGHNNFLTLYRWGNLKEAARGHYNILFHGKMPDLNDTLKYKPTGYRCIGWDVLP